jgi:urea transport system permease protein
VQWLLVLLLLAHRSACPVHAQSANDASFLATLGELREATFNEKEDIAERLSRSGHPNIGAVLTAFLEDRLYFRNDDQKIVLVKSTEGDSSEFELIDPLTLKDTGSAPVDHLTKIGTNNRLRRALRTTVARYGLSNPDASVRLDAMRDIVRSLDDTTVELLRERSGVETDSRVKAELTTGLALAALNDTGAPRRHFHAPHQP